jgi:phosphoglucomutase
MTPGGSGEADWRSFNGNEIGALLAHWTWTQWKARNPGKDPSGVAMLASAVSSKMLAAMVGLYKLNAVDI